MKPVLLTLLAPLVLPSASGLEAIPSVQNPAGMKLEALPQQHLEDPLRIFGRGLPPMSTGSGPLLPKRQSLRQ